ncbi:MAG: phenylalanine--tRNA ligase subunit beta [Bacteroidales bacterium]|jgi:phenylalanyl-tRNA synthetase beta chain|nr:phenylalanine--tRNA ligase subunit beta [Bacteroidales bacterium]
MKVSLNWINEYLTIREDVESVSKILTDIGLEVEGIECFESIKGGLQGVVVGNVLSCEKHPDADKLSVTTVDVGGSNILPIVCGAPNVAAGQKVLVATEGTKLYDGDKEFVIKKAKIRGQVSQGMICAEDELGLGSSHDGIIVLPDSSTIGTPASEIFAVEQDVVFEIGLTPNRIDAASHIGVARDLAAFFSQHNKVDLQKPDVSAFTEAAPIDSFEVVVEREDLCPRYCGVVISNITIQESPQWLQNKLKAIGQKPINNVVDITNFVLHEMAQPLHAFDFETIKGNKISVGTCAEKTKFVTLDEVERELSAEDLMIQNSEEPMCIAGVFGGAHHGVTQHTTSIFLESAYFNPVAVRKTAKRHALNTDASFRFERGIDPNITVYALKRAALLIQELAGGVVASHIFDSNPSPVPGNRVELSVSRVQALIGKSISKKEMLSILQSLEITLIIDEGDTLVVDVPSYRVDVTRQEDIVEEILRIYGYNNIEIPARVKSSLIYSDEIDEDLYKNKAADMFIAQGWFEVMNNSLTKSAYYDSLPTFDKEHLVQLVNPLSADLDVMRSSLLFNMLEVVSYNKNRQNPDVRIFEFGREYSKNPKKQSLKAYSEEQKLALCASGNYMPQHWSGAAQEADYFYMKKSVEMMCVKLGLHAFVYENYADDFGVGQLLLCNNKQVATISQVNSKLVQLFDIDNPVFCADINWDVVMSIVGKPVLYTEIPQFPEVRRDLSLLLDDDVSFAQIEEIAQQTEKKLLKSVSIFDIYQGKGIPEGKKSYAVSFVLQHSQKTLKESDIDKVMKKLISAYSEKLHAELR